MTGFEPAPAVRLIERWLPIADVHRLDPKEI